MRSRLLVALLLAVTASPASAQMFKELHTLRGHKSWVGGVAFSPDGRLLATAGADNTARLWDVETGKQQAVCEGHTDYVCAVAFSPDGRTLLTGSYDKTAKLWEVATGKPLRTCAGHRGVVMSVAFSRDGKTMATGSLDSTAKLWGADTGKERATLVGHRSWVNAVAFSVSGITLLTGSSDGTIKLWNVNEAKERATIALPREAGEVRSLAVSPEGARFAAGMRYGQVVLLEAPLEIRRTIPAHGGDVWGVAVSADASLLASGDGDWNRPGTVKLWDPDTGRLRAELKHTGEVLCVAFARQAPYLAAGSWDGTVKVWTYSR